MPQQTLHQVTVATIPRLKYGSQRGQLHPMCRFYQMMPPSVREMAARADSTLFETLFNKPIHVLVHNVPATSSI